VCRRSCQRKSSILASAKQFSNQRRDECNSRPDGLRSTGPVPSERSRRILSRLSLVATCWVTVGQQRYTLIAGACYVPNALIIPFRIELFRPAA
jgi:hypothetical protein